MSFTAVYDSFVCLCLPVKFSKVLLNALLGSLPYIECEFCIWVRTITTPDGDSMALVCKVFSFTEHCVEICAGAPL